MYGDLLHYGEPVTYACPWTAKESEQVAPDSWNVVHGFGGRFPSFRPADAASRAVYVQVGFPCSPKLGCVFTPEIFGPIDSDDRNEDGVTLPDA